jgi:hypothetical protein
MKIKNRFVILLILFIISSLIFNFGLLGLKKLKVANAAVIITRTSHGGNVFYIDSGVTPQIKCAYVSYQITTDTNITDL